MRHSDGSPEDGPLILTIRLNRPVVERNGIEGDFDFLISFAPTEYLATVGAGPNTFVAGPALFTVLEDELGLKLTSERIPVTVLTIEQLEKPSDKLRHVP